MIVQVNKKPGLQRGRRHPTMQIVSELEPSRRGPYGGAGGHCSCSGNLDSASTILTMVVRDRGAYIQTGAGVVAESEAEREYLECASKAQVLPEAVDLLPGFERRHGPGMPAVGEMIP